MTADTETDETREATTYSDRADQLDGFDGEQEGVEVRGRDRAAEAAADAASETDYDATPRLGRRTRFSVLRKAVRGFRDDHCPDQAAALTYFGVLAIFPAAIALLALLGVVGKAQSSVDAVLDVLRPLVSASMLADIQDPLTRIADSQTASWTLLVGALAALWFASGYVGAFGRAMNRVYGVEEGRPFWRLRPNNVVVTLVSVVLCAASLVILVVSGPVARSVGDRLDMGDQAMTIWNIAKWPALAIVVVLVVAMLYHFTPNVRLPKFRFLSIGAFVAILVWVAASAGFAFYVANFSSYDKTYGAIAGGVVMLLWLWLTNLALLFGAELDAEIERARQLHRGLPAEEHLQLELRSARGIERAQRRREKDVTKAREIRMSRAGTGDPADRPF